MKNGEENERRFEVGKNWNNQKMRLKQKFPQLTDADLRFEPGKEFEMLTKVGAKLDLKLDEVIRILNRVKEESLTDKVSGKPF